MIKCEAGCKFFTGGEIRHHNDCVYYPQSFTEMFDVLLEERNLYREAIEMWKRSFYCDGETVHKFIAKQSAFNKFTDMVRELDARFPKAPAEKTEGEK